MTSPPRPRPSTAWLLGSFVVLSAVSLCLPPYGNARGGFSDHYTHMNAARLFPRVGTGLWTTPIDELLPAASEAQSRLAPADVQGAGAIRVVPEWPAEKPFVGSWTQVPRPYPPGELLFVAPIAVAYQFTGLSFTAACHLLILWFLAASHVAFWLVFENVPERGRAFYMALAVASWAYVMFWTLRGFYDAAAVVPAMWAATCLGRRRWLAACLGLAVAFFIHFRAIFYLPWAAVAAWKLVESRAWRSWRARDWAAVAVGVSLTAASLYTFVLVAPSLGGLPLANPIHPGDLHLAPVMAFAASAILAAALLAREHAYVDVALLIWMTLVFVGTRQLQIWHPFLLLPWIFAPAGAPVVRFARVQWVTVLTLAVIL